MRTAVWIIYALAVVASIADFYYTDKAVRHGLRERNGIVRRLTMPVYLALNAVFLIGGFFSVQLASEHALHSGVPMWLTVFTWRAQAAYHARSVLRGHRLL